MKLNSLPCLFIICTFKFLADTVIESSLQATTSEKGWCFVNIPVTECANVQRAGIKQELRWEIKGILRTSRGEVRGFSGTKVIP